MGRWQPDARGRLELAALELYSERGFDETTVADIAERAGLTERTFFRYYADKREVLFGGARLLQEALVSALRDAPDFLPPIDAVGAALEAVGPIFDDRRPFAQRRQKVIAGNTELQERELIKMATLGSALAGGLVERGVAPVAARLAAEAGIAAFRVAFQRWVDDGDAGKLSHVIRASMEQLKAVAGQRRD